MKKHFFFLLAIFSMMQGFAQSDSVRIIDIDKTIQEIKNDTTIHMVEKAKEQGGGYRHAYIKDKELKRTTVYHRDQNTDKSVEWYFSNGQLIYSEQIWTIIKSQKIVDDEKFYLADGHLFAWIKMNGKYVDKDSKQFKGFEDGLEGYIIKLKEDAK